MAELGSKGRNREAGSSTVVVQCGFFGPTVEKACGTRNVRMKRAVVLCCSGFGLSEPRQKTEGS